MKAERRFKIVMFCTVLTLLVVWVNAGNLNPPNGPISPTMKDLGTVEPRTPISTLPFTISAPGSYYVTKDLTGISGQHGIIINASDVSIDLRGFALHGGTGTLDGITVTGSRSRISIGNGKVAGWDGVGINTLTSNKTSIMYMQTQDNGRGSCGDGDTHVLYMQADNNRTDGIECGDNSVLVDCTCTGTVSGPGIKAGDGSKVENCVSSGNAGDGLTVGQGSIVARCTLTGNTGTGLVASSGPGSRGCNITDCISSSNTNGSGISAAAGSTVTSCTAQANSLDGITVLAGCTVSNCTTRGNSNDGIEAANDCFILNNNSSGNGPGALDGAGIHITGAGGTRVEGNNCVNNDRNFDILASTGNVVARNTSTGGGTGGVLSTGFYITSNNAVGTITVVAGNGSFNAGPWANLQY